MDDGKPTYEEPSKTDRFESPEDDFIVVYDESEVGSEGMRIDRELYIGTFEKTLKEQAENDPEFSEAVKSKDYEFLEEYIKTRVFDRPREYFNLSKLREGYKTDRKVGLWEIIDHVFHGETFKSQKEIAVAEFEKFLIAKGVEPDMYYPTKEFFTLYLVNEDFRTAVNSKSYRNYAGNPEITSIFKSLGKERLELIPTYIHDHVPLNQFH